MTPAPTGEGVPKKGDRSARDTHNYADYHASDIEESEETVHNPWPMAAGEAAVSDGTKLVATDIATQAELDAHTGDTANPHQVTHAQLPDVTSDQHHAQVHALAGTDHTATGSAMDVVGLTAANTLGLLTPSANPGAASALLKTDTSGYLQLAGLGINTAASSTYLLDVAGSVRLTGGLNLGTATGAGAGDIRFSGALRGAGSYSFVRMRTLNIADNGTAQLGDVAEVNGIVWIINASQGYSACFVCRGSIHAALEAFDPSNVFSATADTASSTNVYWSAGNSRYEIQNKMGGTRDYAIMMFKTD